MSRRSRREWAVNSRGGKRQNTRSKACCGAFLNWCGNSAPSTVTHDGLPLPTQLSLSRLEQFAQSICRNPFSVEKMTLESHENVCVNDKF